MFLMCQSSLIGYVPGDEMVKCCFRDIGVRVFVFIPSIRALYVNYLSSKYFELEVSNKKLKNFENFYENVICCFVCQIERSAIYQLSTKVTSYSNSITIYERSNHIMQLLWLYLGTVLTTVTMERRNAFGPYVRQFTTVACT